MNWNDLEKHFSAARVGRYHAAYRGDCDQASMAYTHNMLLAESLMPLLNVTEIALRNGIHRQLSKLYKRSDWWHAWGSDKRFSWQMREIQNAGLKLAARGETQTVDKIVAELTFGFWSSLFNAAFQPILWKDLRLVFPRCPKNQRKRQVISAVLREIRMLRNRVFHHEPLIWLSPSLLELHRKGLAALGWLDPLLVTWLTVHDRLPATWHAWTALQSAKPTTVSGLEHG